MRDEGRHSGEGETWRKERIGGRKEGGAAPLARLSGVVRMMNGRPAQAVRALMGAAELYFTLLSVCERLLKALKSPSSDTSQQAANFHESAGRRRGADAQVRTQGARDRGRV